MKPIEATSINFSEYGILYDMVAPENGSGRVNQDSGDGWEDSNTAIPVIDTLASLGYTLGSAAPFTASEMERHFHTQEALFCQDEPIIFLVAPACKETSPNINDVVPILLKPGTIAVLHRGVWHSSAHGLTKPTRYYYLAQCYKNEPTEWQHITGGPVYVDSE